MDTLCVLLREIITIESDKGTTGSPFGVIDILVDDIRIEAILQNGKGSLREASPVERLGIAEIEDVDPVERYAAVVELVKGLYLIRETRITFLIGDPTVVGADETEVSDIVLTLEVCLRSRNGVEGAVDLGIDGAIGGSGRELTHLGGWLYLSILLIGAGGVEDIPQVALNAIELTALHGDVGEALIV
jgi:hypothetical protein